MGKSGDPKEGKKLCGLTQNSLPNFVKRNAGGTAEIRAQRIGQFSICPAAEA